MVSVRVRMAPVMWWMVYVSAAAVAFALLLMRVTSSHRSGDTIRPSSHGGGGETRLLSICS